MPSRTEAFRFIIRSCLCTVLLILIQSLASAYGQKPLKGVAWNPPTGLDRAVQDLIDMKRIGVEAVRSPLLNNEALYQIADSLQLQLFQELPFENLTSSSLLDTIASAQQVLREALLIASNHTSTRHFGLSRHSDTSTEEACRFFEKLTGVVNSAAHESISFYYTTLFIEDDECSHTVDLVMVDALDEQNVLRKKERWSKSHPDVPLGYSSLGTWVAVEMDHEAEEAGYLLPHSTYYQARFLEVNLSRIFYEETSDPLQVVFVYQWRDQRLSYPSPANDLKYPYRYTYGLFSNRDNPRPSFEVVRGIFSNTQQVFAFPMGQPSSDRRYWIVFLIWVTLFILSVSYAHFPRFRLTVRRYFTAHSFFREAIREGRELLLGPNTLLFVSVSIAFGICWVVLLNIFRTSDAFSLLIEWAPRSMQFTLVAFLAQPFLLFVVIGGSFAIALTIWTSVIAVVSSRASRSLLPGQSFMLVVWSQWPYIITMLAAGVIETLHEPFLTSTAIVLALALLIIIGLSTLITLQDYLAICKVHPIQLIVTLITNPLILLILTCMYFCVKYSEKFQFIFHLITRN